MEKHNFIFFDPKGHRKKVFWSGILISLFGIGIVAAGMSLTLFTVPKLPKIFLEAPKIPKFKSVFNRKEARFDRTRNRLERSKNPNSEAKIDYSSKIDLSEQKRIGFVVNWDDTSFTSLQKNLDKLNVIIPENLHLDDIGSLQLDDPKKENMITNFIRKNSTKTEIWPLLNNYQASTGDWQELWVSKVLENPDKRQQLITKLVNYLDNGQYDGLTIDWENLSKLSWQKIPEFLGELKMAMPSNKQLAMTVPAENSEVNYQEIGQRVDWVIVMAYDEHWPGGTPGPIASQDWFAKITGENLKRMPPQKTIMALANYGYDWPEKGNANDISFQEAIRIAKESEALVNLESGSLNPTFEYYDENNKLRTVYFTDAITIFNQLGILGKFKPGGVALWRLGSEDPAIWRILNTLNINLDEAKSNELSRLEYGYDIDYEGKGEILKIVSTPKSGHRKIIFDKQNGLINSEIIDDYPNSYVIERHGQPTEKKVALTFDDGPDSFFTPKILDILKEKKVLATFFIMGDNADKNQSILQRIYSEGHEIGNHTFSHPNISTISDGQLKLELNTTERLLESRLGINTLLFRPPYAEDIEPETPDQVKPLLLTSQLGYYTVGIGIDPKDWDKTNSDDIVASTLEQINTNKGRVILLHDSGGDRTQTIKALPRLIDRLQENGWKFVPISELMGVPKSEIMPKVSNTDEGIMVTIDSIGFWLLDIVRFFLYYLFFVGVILGLIRFVFVALLAVLDKWKDITKTKKTDGFDGLVSVIIPAYNEAVVVEKTIKSVLAGDYQKIEIIAVNDGSTDNTLLVLQKCRAEDKRVLVVNKENSGKADSINVGIRESHGQVLVVIDADTVFDKKTIKKLVRHFLNPEIGAVAGNVKVGNKVNWLTKIQGIEYTTSQNLDRRAFDLINGITVVPGAIGAWRKSLVEKLGGFGTDTLAEDADLTYSIIESGSKIIYEEKAVAYTEAPENLSSFVKQRFRWMFGTIQVVYKHRKSCFGNKNIGLGWIAIPQVIIFQIIFPILAPLVDLVAGINLFSFWINSKLHPESFSLRDIGLQMSFYIAFLVVDFLSGSLALWLENEESILDLKWLFVQRLFFRQIMYFISLKSLIAIVEGRLVGWNKFGRSGGVGH